MGVIDAHHHLWDPRVREYPFLRSPDLAPIRRPYGLGDLRERCAAAGVSQTVLVQTVADVTETREFLEIADDSDGLIRGVVGWVDLRDGGLAGTLDDLRAARGGRHLVGIRHQAQDESDAGWLARPDVIAGLRRVAAAGLTFDLLVLPHQLAAAVRAARVVPEGRFVLDHLAKPALDGVDADTWRSGIHALAALPNVACKLSGLVSLGAGVAATASELRPFVDEVLDAFGPSRVMFGTDWPVCDAVSDVTAVRALADQFTAELSADERREVFGGAARAAYALDSHSD